MSVYDVVLFAHILGVLGMFAVAGLNWAVAIGVRHARSIADVRLWSGLEPTIQGSHPITTPLIVLSGGYMVANKWGFLQAWVDVSLLGLAVIIALGISRLAPQLRAIRDAASEAPDGAIPEALTRLIEAPAMYAGLRVQSMMAIGVVFLMTTKPDLVGTLVVAAIIVVLGVWWARMPFASARAVARQATLG